MVAYCLQSGVQSAAPVSSAFSSLSAYWSASALASSASPLFSQPSRSTLVHDLIRFCRYFDMLSNLVDTAPLAWEAMLPGCPEDLVQLVSELVCFQPGKRRTATECLSHTAFEGLHLPSDEPECPKTFGFVTEDWEAQKVKLCV